MVETHMNDGRLLWKDQGGAAAMQIVMQEGVYYTYMLGVWMDTGEPAKQVEGQVCRCCRPLLTM